MTGRLRVRVSFFLAGHCAACTILPSVNFICPLTSALTTTADTLSRTMMVKYPRNTKMYMSFGNGRRERQRDRERAFALRSLGQRLWRAGFNSSVERLQQHSQELVLVAQVMDLTVPWYYGDESRSFSTVRLELYVMLRLSIKKQDGWIRTHREVHVGKHHP